MSESMKTTLNELCQKDIATASDAELYTALLKLVQEQSQKQIKPVTGRKLYYIYRRAGTGTKSWKWWSWTTCCMFS